MPGKVIIFSAPSGSGKTTIVQHLLQKYPFLDFSISVTTRSPRESEVDGKDYHFISQAAFENHIEKNELVEWQEVYPGKFYGTLKSEIQRIWDKGCHVIFDVDVIGGLNLKKYFKDDALAVFVKVSSLEILRDRLQYRNSESAENMAIRLNKAMAEYEFANEFDVTIVNDELPLALQQAESLVTQFIFAEKNAE